MSIFEHEAETLTGERIALSDFQGKALLVVNVASRCGLTPQYAALEALHEELGPRGFSVVGFPSNQFAGQEPGNAEEIQAFCSTTYGVTFPMMAKTDVKGEGQHPVYAELTRFPAGDDKGEDVLWNFEKFLVAPSGEVVGRFRPQVTPDDPELRAAVEAVLPA